MSTTLVEYVKSAAAALACLAVLAWGFEGHPHTWHDARSGAGVVAWECGPGVQGYWAQGGPGVHLYLEQGCR